MQLKIVDAFVSAIASGIQVSVAQFKLASGYGYQALGTESNLQGTVVYSGAPTSISTVDPNTVEFTLRVEKNIGPFSYGEVGLFTSSGALFALATFDTLQYKTAIPQTNPFALVIAARLTVATNRVAQIVWQVVNTTYASVPYLASVDLLSAPSLPAAFPMYLTGSFDDQGNAIEAVKKSANEWTFSTHHHKVVSGTILSGTLTSITSPAISAAFPFSFQTGEYLLQITSGPLAGSVRSLISSAPNQVNWATNLAALPTPGASFTIMRSNGAAIASSSSAVEDALLLNLVVPNSRR